MQNGKLIKLFKKLNSDEFRRFYKYIKSPFFTTNIHLVKMYEVLRRFYPSFDSPKLDKEKIFAKLFPDQPFNYEKFAALLKRMVRLVEDYMLWLELQEDKKARENHLMKIYLKRDLFDFYNRKRAKILAKLNEQTFRDLDYYQNQTKLDFDYFFHPLTQKHTLNDETLIRLMDGIDKQFVLAKYRIGSEMKNRERILSKDYQIRFLEAIKIETDKGFFSENILLKIFQLLFDLYNPQKAEKVFFELKEIINQYITELPRVDQSLFLTQLINYAVYQINSGNANFYSEALDLYKLGLKIDLVIENQKINDGVFGNIVLLGCHAKEFEWIKQFIEDYQQFLKDSIREDTVALNKGLLFFHQNDFDSAYSQLINHSFSIEYQPKARINLIRTLFEQFLKDVSLFNLLIAQIEAFEKFLHRSQMLSNHHKEVYLNGIKILKKLTHGIFHRKNVKNLKTSILNDISKKGRVIGKDWLIKKVKELK